MRAPSSESKRGEPPQTFRHFARQKVSFRILRSDPCRRIVSTPLFLPLSAILLVFFVYICFLDRFYHFQLMCHEQPTNNNKTTTTLSTPSCCSGFRRKSRKFSTLSESYRTISPSNRVYNNKFTKLQHEVMATIFKAFPFSICIEEHSSA